MPRYRPPLALRQHLTKSRTREGRDGSDTVSLLRKWHHLRQWIASRVKIRENAKLSLSSTSTITPHKSATQVQQPAVQPPDNRWALSSPPGVHSSHRRKIKAENSVFLPHSDVISIPVSYPQFPQINDITKIGDDGGDPFRVSGR